MKKVNFAGKRPSADMPSGGIDNWVANQGASEEFQKRMTVDVPISLHRRIKSQCALQNLVMSDVIRELLEKRFPESGQMQGGGES